MARFLETTINQGNPVMIKVEDISAVSREADGQVNIWVKGCDEPFVVHTSYNDLRELLLKE